MNNDFKTLPTSFLNMINALIKTYTEKYQNIPLKNFFNIELDTFFEDLVILCEPQRDLRSYIIELKNHLVEFQASRNQYKQDSVPYRLDYIYVKEFYWAISNFVLGDPAPNDKRVLFTELMYIRHQLFSLKPANKDLTLTNGKTYYSEALYDFYQNESAAFGINDHFYRLEWSHFELDKPMASLYKDNWLNDKIEEIDHVLSDRIGLYFYIVAGIKDKKED